jgi:hypothetical protein
MIEDVSCCSVDVVMEMVVVAVAEGTRRLISARVEAAGNERGAHKEDGKANSFMSDLQQQSFNNTLLICDKNIVIGPVG